jgi:4,5-dihydroxyphthalate decarboxylase
MALRLKTTCAPNPRIEPLVEGVVKPAGIEFDWALQPVPPLFQNNVAKDGLEFSEMSMSETFLCVERRESIGHGRWNWWALPIYLARGHFWTGIMVNNESGIKDLGDLKGKQVGVPDYCMTAALWMKVTLKDLYGIEAKDIEWHNMHPRGASQMYELELDKDNPPGVTINWLTKEDDPIAMLERGELDAAMGYDPRLRESSKAHRLLPDNGAELIREFYRKTGCHQPNHHFIIQKRLLDQQPEAAMELYNAFNKSKQIAYERGGKSSPSYLYFEGDDAQKQDAVFGDDPYPMGLKAMGRSLERLVLGSLEQGLLRRPVKLEEVYHLSTLNT